jgi:glutamyl-Q tRNA(Asp) synthetase
MGSALTRVFRFAPSPNGYLHRGHAFSVLLNYRAAQEAGGRFLLRIEDIDQTRARPHFEDAIYEDLAWLGLTWEEPVLRQSQRFEAYRAALQELDRLDLLYPAFLSRSEALAEVARAEAKGRSWPRDPEDAPLYPGVEREWTRERRKSEIANGRPYALRLDMRRALTGLPALVWREANPVGAEQSVTISADPAAWGDVILARNELPASYHLSVVVDDAFQGVTDVVRGLDLKPATSVHRLLQALLKLPEPSYFHHRLILDESGKKLAKSRASESLRGRRASGEPPEALIEGLSLAVT